MNLTRRRFLGFGTALASGASVGFSLLHARSAAAVGFGPLVDDPAGVIDLPPGFRYQVLQTAGDVMSDGRVVRGATDGMAAFPGPGPNQIILMRNHELSVDGGVSRLVLDASDPHALVVVSSNDVLGGTVRNCAGGPSPWGWLSCEEHATGGVWLCPLDAESLLQGAERVRIDAYGSFCHEAVAVDPDTFVAYLSEDDGDSFFYRFVPTNPEAKGPFEGKLQAMKRAGVGAFSTATMSPGESIEVEWVDVSAQAARADAQSAGATVIVRGEGIWWFDGKVYFTATSNNQVFELTPGVKKKGDTLRLLASGLSGPDNVTVAPWGELFVAEDNGGANRVRIVDRGGAVADFAKNRVAPSSEFAGVCFSPDGAILFVNIYGLGLTLAITGPFPGAPEPPGGWGGGGNGGGGGGDATAGGSDAGGASDGGEAGEPAMGEAGQGAAAAGAGGSVSGAPVAAAAGDEGIQSELIAGGGCACTTPAARPGALGELAALGGALLVTARRERRKTDA